MITKEEANAAAVGTVRMITGLWEQGDKLAQECVQLRRQVQQLDGVRPTRADKRAGNVKTLYTATSVAKIFGLSAVEFNRLLRKMGVLCWSGGRGGGGRWVLTSAYHRNAYMCRRTYKITRADGRPDTVEHSYWTQQGVDFICPLLVRAGFTPVGAPQVPEWFDNYADTDEGDVSGLDHTRL